MTTKKILILSLAKIDLFAYPILITLMCYFAFITGGFKGSDTKYIIIDICIIGLSMLIMEWTIMYRKVSRLMHNVDDERYDRSQIKKDLLSFPFYIGLQYIVLWCIAISIILLLFSINIDLTLMNSIPFILLLPVMALINYNIGFLISENSLVEILSSESIRDVELPEGSYKNVILNRRITILSLSSALVPVIVLGYFLYLVNTERLLINNFWYHIGFIGILSAITQFGFTQPSYEERD